jgi:hypothetical protein
MIIYNVTCNVEKPLASEWLEWMKSVHIPEVMATGCFLENKILKLHNAESDDEGINYAIQYTCNNIETLERYRSEFGPDLQAKTFEKYGNKVLAYRSVLEIIE